MSEGEKFCLKWNDFQTNISSCFRELREDIDFTDMTLSCENNQSVQVHKFILAASSPIFKEILKNNKHSHPLIYMRGMKAKDLMSIVDFLYHGEVSIYQEDLNSFLSIAEEIQLKGLAGSQTAKDEMISSLNYNHNVEGNHVKNEKQSDTTEFKGYEKSNIAEINDPKQGKEIVMLNPDSTPNIEELDRLIDTMMEKYNGTWTCKVCGKTSGGMKPHMRNHIEALHIEGVNHICNLCGNYFRSRHSRAVHISRDHKLK